MSQQIVGLDIGSYSVKVLRIESGFRSQQVIGFDEALVRPITSEPDLEHEPDEDGETEEIDLDETELVEVDEAEAHEEALRHALAELSDRGALAGDVVIVSYGLHRCLQTTTELPFTQRRQIEQVLPAQIEDRLPVELDDLTLEFQVAPPSLLGGDEASSMKQIDVVAAPTEELSEHLALLAECGVDPHVIDVSAARLKTAYQHLAEPSSRVGAVALVDVGHRFTDICLVDGNAIRLMRRLHHGGAQITQALVETLSIPWEEAEYRKVDEASIDVSEAAPPALSPQQVEMRRICQIEMTRLTDELRRTFQSYLARGGLPVDRVVLCGGGSLLRGLPQFVAAALDVPVELMQVPEAVSAGPGAPFRAVGALGLARRGAGQRGASRFNLRRGVFAFRGDFEFVRARSRALLIMGGLVVAALLFTLIAQRSALVARRDAYAEALCSTTQVVLNECINDPNLLMARLAASQAPIDLPDTSAYDLFRDISTELVYLREDLEIPLDIERLTVDIQRDVITIRGNTDSAESVDEIVTSLDTLECVEEVASESTTQNRATGMFDFVLRAVNGCQ